MEDGWRMRRVVRAAHQGLLPEDWISREPPNLRVPTAHILTRSSRTFSRTKLLSSPHAAWARLPIVHGMVDGMATAKITITLPDRQLEEIRKRVAAQNSPSVSGFIQQAVQKSLENAAEFRAIVEEALKTTGGPLKPKERAWARKMLAARKRGTKPRKAA